VDRRRPLTPTFAICGGPPNSASTPVRRAPLVARAVEIASRRFHPRQYLSRNQAIEGDGCAIPSTPRRGRDRSAAVVVGHRIRCDDVVVATHNPIVGKAD
jgi:hypothetical protein